MGGIVVRSLWKIPSQAKEKNLLRVGLSTHLCVSSSSVTFSPKLPVFHSPMINEVSSSHTHRPLKIGSFRAVMRQKASHMLRE